MKLAVAACSEHLRARERLPTSVCWRRGSGSESAALTKGRPFPWQTRCVVLSILSGWSEKKEIVAYLKDGVCEVKLWPERFLQATG